MFGKENDQMNTLCAIKDNLFDDGCNINEMKQRQNSATSTTAQMTPNDKSFKGRCGSYSAHATPRRRKGRSITTSDDSIDATEDINLAGGQPKINEETANSSHYFKDIFGNRLSQYLSTLSFSTPFLSFSNDSILDSKSHEKQNCDSDVTSANSKNVKDNIKSSCVHDNESLLLKHATHSEIEPEKMCNISHENNCHAQRSTDTTGNFIPCDSIKLNDTSFPPKSVNLLRKRSTNTDSKTSKTSSPVKQPVRGKEKYTQTKPNQKSDLAKSITTTKHKKPASTNDNDRSTKIILDVEDNHVNNEKCNIKLSTAETSKQRQSKAFQSQSFESRSSIKRENNTNLSKCQKENRNENRPLLKNQVSENRNPEFKVSNASITQTEPHRDVSTEKRKRTQNKSNAIHTFGKAKHHVLSLSSRTENPILFENRSKQKENEQMVKGKPRYSSLSVIPNSLDNSLHSNSFAKPLEPSSSISNLKSRLLASDRISFTGAQQISSNSCVSIINQRLNNETSPPNVSKPFFMLTKTSENVLSYNNKTCPDPIHYLELSETTCSLPNTPFKKRLSEPLENNEKKNDQNNHQTSNLNINVTIKKNLASSPTIEKTSSTFFNRSKSSLNNQTSKTKGHPIWTVSKERSQSVQTLPITNGSEHLGHLPTTARRGLLHERLSQGRQSSLNPSSCYVDKEWKVRVWSELINFSFDCYGSVCVTANSNISAIQDAGFSAIQDSDTSFKNELPMPKDSPREEFHPLGFLGFKSLQNTPRGSGEISIASSSITNLSQFSQENVLVQFEHNCSPTISYTRDWNFQPKPKTRSESCCVLKRSEADTSQNASKIMKTNRQAKQFSAKRLNDILWYRFLSRLELRSFTLYANNSHVQIKILIC